MLHLLFASLLVLLVWLLHKLQKFLLENLMLFALDWSSIYSSQSLSLSLSLLSSVFQLFVCFVVFCFLLLLLLLLSLSVDQLTDFGGFVNFGEWLWQMVDAKECSENFVHTFFCCWFLWWGGEFLRKLCVFLRFLWLLFVLENLWVFLCLLLVEIERVMKRWDFYSFCCSFFFLFPGFFWVGTVLMGCTNLQVMNEEAAALIFSSLSRSSWRKIWCKASKLQRIWPNPTTLLCFSSSSSSSFGSVWSVLDAKTIQKSCNCGKDKTRVRKAFHL